MRYLKIVLLVLVIWISAWSSQVLGEEKQEVKQPPTNPSEPEKATSDKESDAITKNPKTKRPLDIFQPSEEISEDFAVSFPVDI